MDSLYKVIFDWFAGYVFTAGDLPNASWNIGGAELTIAEWLSHSATIVVLVAMCCFLFGVVVWFGKLVAGLITRVGR